MDADDKVWQEALLLKLLKIGVRRNFFGVIRSMYTTLQWVRKYTYLGILVNSNGDFLSSSAL